MQDELRIGRRHMCIDGAVPGGVYDLDQRFSMARNLAEIRNFLDANLGSLGRKVGGATSFLSAKQNSQESF